MQTISLEAAATKSTKTTLGQMAAHQLIKGTLLTATITIEDRSREVGPTLEVATQINKTINLRSSHKKLQWAQHIHNTHRVSIVIRAPLPNM